MANETNSNGLTFDQYLQKVGYKSLKFPTFDEWLRKLFDYNANGTIDKGKEQRNYKKAAKNTSKQAEYLANYQHAAAAAMAEDEATVENLRVLWLEGNLESGQAQAVRDAQRKAENGYLQENGSKKIWLIAAAVVVAALLLLKK